MQAIKHFERCHRRSNMSRNGWRKNLCCPVYSLSAAIVTEMKRMLCSIHHLGRGAAVPSGDGIVCWCGGEIAEAGR